MTSGQHERCAAVNAARRGRRHARAVRRPGAVAIFLIMPRVDHDDDSLIRRIMRGEEEALRALYERHGRLVYGLALRIVKDPSVAEEVAQDVFLRVWEKADTYRSEKAQVRTWLARIARNRAIDVLRRRTTLASQARGAWEDMKSAAQDAQEDPSRPVEERFLRGRIHEALASLPAEQRDMLARAFFSGQTHRQIAESTGEPLGTVKSRIRAAMLKLRDALEKDAAP